MKIAKILGIMVMIVCLFTVPAAAGDFDGSKDLLCAVMDIIECLPGGKCIEVTAEEVGIPNFLRIDFKKQKLSATFADGSQKISPIVNLEKIDGKVILQGAEDGIEGVRDGLGWSLAIDEKNGKMVLTASGDAVAFAMFGACTLP
jgi:hypothetical protein